MYLFKKKSVPFDQQTRLVRRINFKPTN